MEGAINNSFFWKIGGKIMFEWNVEDMKLLNQKSSVMIGKEKIYNCESDVKREDKITFVDKMQDPCH